MKVTDWFCEALKDLMPLEGFFLMGIPICYLADLLQVDEESFVKREIENMLNQKQNFRNVVSIAYLHERERADAFQVYRTISITNNLKVCLWTNYYQSLRALLDYYEFWGRVQYRELYNYLRVFSKLATEEATRAVFFSRGFRYYLQSLSFTERDEILRAFIRKYPLLFKDDSLYAMHFLAPYLDKRTFKRTQDFSYFESALKNVDPCIFNLYCYERKERLQKFVPYLKRVADSENQ